MTNIGLSVRSYREGKMFHFDGAKEQVVETRSAPRQPFAPVLPALRS